MLRAVKRGLVRIGCSVLSILRGHRGVPDPTTPLASLQQHYYRFEPYETPHVGTLDYIALAQTATEPIVRLLCHPSLS